MARSVSTDKSTTFSDIKNKKKPRVISQPILMEPTLVDEYQEAKSAYEEARKRHVLATSAASGVADPAIEADLREAEKRYNKIQKLVDDATVVFRFKALGRTKMEELLSEHPPTKKQIAEAKEDGISDLTYNPETFPQALIAESCVEPEMTPEEVQDLWDGDDWTTSELLILFTAAQKANIYVGVDSLKKGSGLTRN